LHTHITIKGDINNPLFRASDISSILEMTNIRASMSDFDSSEKVSFTLNTIGGQQQVLFLTEKGLYKILFKSRKPIAEEFQNWVCEVIKEIRLTGVYDLQQQLEQQNNKLAIMETTNKEMETKMSKQKSIERERVLLDKFGNSGPLVYIIKVKTFENGQYVVKIGHSQKGIQSRYNEHKKNYDECLLLDCFCADKSKELESFIHNSQLIRTNKVTDLAGHESENELFLIGTNLTYQMVLKLIEDNIQRYNYTVNELLRENELLKLQVSSQSPQTNNDAILQELLNTVKTLSNKIDSLEKTITNNQTPSHTKISTGFNQQLPTLGPRLQKINPETMSLVKVYESVTEAMNENKNIKRPSINKAISDNTIYCGYRWLLVERNLDPNTIHKIEVTKETNVQNTGYIAKIDKDKKEILNVYLDRKTAALSNGYISSSALDNPVKNKTLSKGFYFMLYSECDQKLIEHFEMKNNRKPLLYKNGIGQYNMNNELVREFSCKYDCLRELKMSDKTLKKALDTGCAYNNYYYKELGSKLQVCL